MKKVYVHQRSDGCIESFLDFKNSRSALINSGWEVTDRPEDADMVLVNTCVVGKIVEDHCVEDIQNLKSVMKDSAELVVTGCMPDYAPGRLKDNQVDFSYGPRSLSSFLERFNLQSAGSSAQNLESMYLGPYNLFNWAGRLLRRTGELGIPMPAHLYRRFSLVEDSKMEFIRISRGCLQHCTYCATRFATGRLVSDPLDDILQRVDRALKGGKRSLVLCGEDTGCWGRDIGLTFPDLLEAILSRKEDFALSIRQHQPQWVLEMQDRYLQLFADSRVKSLMLPIQSGSDRILKLMGRRYSADQVEELVSQINRVAPHLMLRTHVIVGFPTETREDYLKTERLVRKLRWDMVLVFPYTDRPRTAAQRIKQKVPQKTILRRRLRLTGWVLWDLYLNQGSPLPLTRSNPMA